MDPSRTVCCLDSKHTQEKCASFRISQQFQRELCFFSKKMRYALGNDILWPIQMAGLHCAGARGVCNEITLYMGLRRTMTLGCVQYRKSAEGRRRRASSGGCWATPPVKKQSSFSRLRALRVRRMCVCICGSKRCGEGEFRISTRDELIIV